MLGTMKGCDEEGYPLQGADKVPKGPRFPAWSPREVTIPRLVQLLQDANRHEDRANRALEDLHGTFQQLQQKNPALNYRDYCKTCQKRKETTPEDDTYTLYGKCSKNHQTTHSLKHDLAKKDEEIRYWQDCYEMALGEQFPDTALR